MILIRDFSQEKKKKKRKLLVAIVLVLVWFSIFIYKKELSNVSTKKEIPMAQNKTGQAISVEGKIKESNHFPNYTHTITENETTYGLRSSSININNYIWKKINIGWTINDVYEGTPIIEVNQVGDEENNLFIKNNKYIFTQDLLMFDFSSQTDLSAQKSGNYINILYQGNPIIQIESFTCTKVTATHDCEKLRMNYQSSEKENFVSFIQQTFYRQEKTSWITFNDDMIGYIFKPENDDTLLNTSHLIHVINEEFLIKYKRNLIDEACKDKENTLQEIGESNVEILDENIIRRIINGETDSWKIATCKIAINIGKNRKIEDTTWKIEE